MNDNLNDIQSSIGFNDSDNEARIIRERFRQFSHTISEFDRDLEQGLLNSFEDQVGKIGKETLTSNEFANIARYIPSERLLVTEECFCGSPFTKKSLTLALPCRHKYHVPCLYKWLTTGSRKCPACRADAITGLPEEL